MWGKRLFVQIFFQQMKSSRTASWRLPLLTWHCCVLTRPSQRALPPPLTTLWRRRPLSPSEILLGFLSSCSTAPTWGRWTHMCRENSMSCRWTRAWTWSTPCLNHHHEANCRLCSGRRAACSTSPSVRTSCFHHRCILWFNINNSIRFCRIYVWRTSRAMTQVLFAFWLSKICFSGIWVSAAVSFFKW